MNKKVKELIEATGAWVAVCMKQYPDSRFVDDKLVRVCAALSAFESIKTPLASTMEKIHSNIVIVEGTHPIGKRLECIFNLAGSDVEHCKECLYLIIKSARIGYEFSMNGNRIT